MRISTIETFAAHARRVLPSYAVPLFVRIGSEAAVTSTFKHNKQQLVREGFDPAKAEGKLFVLRNAVYEELSPDTYQSIVSGTVRL